MSHMHNEGRLLVLCARTTINSFVRVEVEDLAGEPVDWETVWQLSKAQRVVPLVYRTLLAVCPAAMPSPLHHAFRRHLQSNALLHTVLAEELLGVLNALSAKGIRAIPLNGLTLSCTAYGDPSLRECTALDLIVDKGSISQASQILWSQGYQLTPSNEDDGNEAHQGSLSFRKKNGIIAVNLHWSLTGRHFNFQLDRSQFWDRLKPVPLLGQSILCLSPEDLLIVLCAHGLQRAWEQLQWICDVAELVRRRPALDWSRVWFQADDWDCRRMVILGLAMARKFFDTTLPRTVLDEIDSDAELSMLVHRMPQQLLKNPDQGISVKCAEALYLTLKDSWWGRCKLGVALCRDRSVVLGQPLPWFRFQTHLRRLFLFFQPLQWVLSRCVPAGRIRRAAIRWLENAS
jgi:hypothetical protein